MDHRKSETRMHKLFVRHLTKLIMFLRVQQVCLIAEILFAMAIGHYIYPPISVLELCSAVVRISSLKKARSHPIRVVSMYWYRHRDRVNERSAARLPMMKRFSLTTSSVGITTWYGVELLNLIVMLPIEAIVFIVHVGFGSKMLPIACLTFGLHVFMHFANLHNISVFYERAVVDSVERTLRTHKHVVAFAKSRASVLVEQAEDERRSMGTPDSGPLRCVSRTHINQVARAQSDTPQAHRGTAFGSLSHFTSDVTREIEHDSASGKTKRSRGRRGFV